MQSNATQLEQNALFTESDLFASVRREHESENGHERHQQTRNDQIVPVVECFSSDVQVEFQ